MARDYRRDLIELQSALSEKSKLKRLDSRLAKSIPFAAALRGRAGGLSEAADWIESLLAGNYSYKKFVRLAVPTEPGFYLPARPLFNEQPNFPLLLTEEGEWWGVSIHGRLHLAVSELSTFGPFTPLKEAAA